MVSGARWSVLGKRGPPGEETTDFFPSVHKSQTEVGEKLAFNMEEQLLRTQVIAEFVFYRRVLCISI